MFAQMERIYVLERAAGARDAKEARGLPTGRPAKLNATTRAGAAPRINGAIPEQVAAELCVGRSALYRDLRKHQPRSLISDPSRIPAGQRYPLVSQWVLPGPQHLATLATDDGLWS
ncbi:hypothetical protein [Streptomyces mirabilis]|uniref:hypothetical protein n=1 Tax=Streptomyces mirabilis TaxID=68239 RepID=UPI00369DB08C